MTSERNPISMGSPACSVVIPTYNREGLLRRTLEHLTLQRLPGEHFEVIVVDDGSSDNSAEVVNSFSGMLDINYFWQSDEGFRAAAARNVGIRHSRSPLLIFLDCGVFVKSNFVQSHLVEHRRHILSNAAVIGYTLCFDDKNFQSARIISELSLTLSNEYFDKVANSPSHADVREKLYSVCGDDLSTLASPWAAFWTCNVSVMRSDLEKVGGFDEAFTRWGGEDIELGYRLYIAGIKLVLNRHALGVHHPHPFSDIDKGIGALQNYRYFAKKHGMPIRDILHNRLSTLS